MDSQTADPKVGRYREVDNRPLYRAPLLVGQYHAIPVAGDPDALCRLTYYDEDLAAEAIEQIECSEAGRQMLLPSQLGIGRDVHALNKRRLLLELAQKVRSSAVYDFSSGEEVSLKGVWLHPGQVVVLTGRVLSAEKVLPTDLLLVLGGEVVRILVREDHCLHLNRDYVAASRVSVIGTVRGLVPRQVRAVAIVTSLL